MSINVQNLFRLLESHTQDLGKRRDSPELYLDPCRVFLSLLRCLCLFILVLRFLRTLSAYIAPAGASVNELHAVARVG